MDRHLWLRKRGSRSYRRDNVSATHFLKYESKERAPLMLHAIRIVPPISHFCSSRQCKVVHERLLPWIECRLESSEYYGMSRFMINFGTISLYCQRQTRVWPIFWTPKNKVAKWVTFRKVLIRRIKNIRADPVMTLSKLLLRQED